MIHDFEKFYDDVIGEFRAAGTVVMFKVRVVLGGDVEWWLFMYNI